MASDKQRQMTGKERERVHEAAAHETLDAENERLRFALQLIANGSLTPDAFPGCTGFELAAKSSMLIARAALE